jgi:hypothetical protein
MDYVTGLGLAKIGVHRQIVVKTSGVIYLKNYELSL